MKDVAIGDSSTIHVCYALRDEHGTYSKLAGVSIYSLLAHTNSRVHIHILHDETLTSDNKLKFQKIGADFRQTIDFHLLQIDTDEPMYKTMAASRYTMAALFRMFIGDHLPKSIDKLIYLDVDTVINLDIADLWNENMNGKEIAAVSDTLVSSKTIPLYLCRAGLVAWNKYFNSGVIMIDMVKFRRRKNLLSDGVNFLNEHPECYCYDQDILNYFFRDNCHLLPAKYNLFVRWEIKEKHDIKTAIYHYSDNVLGIKSNNIYNNLFWHTFSKTPWFDNIFLHNIFNQSMAMYDSIKIKLRDFYRVYNQQEHCFIWGPGGQTAEFLRLLLQLKDRGYYLVSGEEKGQIDTSNLKQALATVKGKYAIVVMVTAFYAQARQQLISMGFEENKDFIDGSILLTIAEGGRGIDEYKFIMQL